MTPDFGSQDFGSLQSQNLEGSFQQLLDSKITVLPMLILRNRSSRIRSKSPNVSALKKKGPKVSNLNFHNPSKSQQLLKIQNPILSEISRRSSVWNGGPKRSNCGPCRRTRALSPPVCQRYRGVPLSPPLSHGHRRPPPAQTPRNFFAPLPPQLSPPLKSEASLPAAVARRSSETRGSASRGPPLRGHERRRNEGPSRRRHRGSWAGLGKLLHRRGRPLRVRPQDPARRRPG